MCTVNMKILKDSECRFFRTHRARHGRFPSSCCVPYISYKLRYQPPPPMCIALSPLSHNRNLEADQRHANEKMICRFMIIISILHCYGLQLIATESNGWIATGWQIVCVALCLPFAVHSLTPTFYPSIGQWLMHDQIRAALLVVQLTMYRLLIVMYASTIAPSPSSHHGALSFSSSECLVTASVLEAWPRLRSLTIAQLVDRLIVA